MGAKSPTVDLCGFKVHEGTLLNFRLVDNVRKMLLLHDWRPGCTCALPRLHILKAFKIHEVSGCSRQKCLLRVLLLIKALFHIVVFRTCLLLCHKLRQGLHVEDLVLLAGCDLAVTDLISELCARHDPAGGHFAKIHHDLGSLTATHHLAACCFTFIFFIKIDLQGRRAKVLLPKRLSLVVVLKQAAHIELLDHILNRGHPLDPILIVLCIVEDIFIIIVRCVLLGIEPDLVLLGCCLVLLCVIEDILILVLTFWCRLLQKLLRVGKVVVRVADALGWKDSQFHQGIRQARHLLGELFCLLLLCLGQDSRLNHVLNGRTLACGARLQLSIQCTVSMQTRSKPLFLSHCQGLAQHCAEDRSHICWLPAHHPALL
mmetsp:Transcript_21388/g.49764  ORF Transcript_21388/g.49764 Transcript_21388/m.49764 type:complete len:373 (-) Transcript_21388:71-1189(-)